MAAAIDNEPGKKLGAKFWVPWSLGLLAIIGGFTLLLMWTVIREWSALVGGLLVIGLTICMWGMGLIAWRARKLAGLADPMRPAGKRYMLRFMPAMLGYVIILMIAITVYKTFKPEGVLLWAVALMPALPTFYAIRAVGLMVKEETDEFLRAKLLAMNAWTNAALLGVCTAVGFLDMFGAIPHIPLWVVFPLWAVLMIPGFAATRRSLR